MSDLDQIYLVKNQVAKLLQFPYDWEKEEPIKKLTQCLKNIAKEK